MQYFDYQRVAKEARIPAGKLALICAMFRRDYPRDDMLYELHVLRACMAIRDGNATLDEILKTELAGQV